MNTFIWNIEYYLITKPKQFFSSIKWFFKNVVFFKKELWKYRPWDHHYCKDFYSRSIEGLHNQLLFNGMEVYASRIKKCEAMEKLLLLLDIECCSYKTREAVLTQIFDILKGQSEEDIEKEAKKIIKRLKKEAWPEEYNAAKKRQFIDQYYDAHNGTGCNTWWD